VTVVLQDKSYDIGWTNVPKSFKVLKCCKLIDVIVDS